jgi:RNA polymerase-binding protein DksA
VPATKVPATKAPAKTAAAAAKAPAEKDSLSTAPAGAEHAAPSGTDLTAADLTEIRARLQDELAEMQLEYDRSMSQLDDLRQYQDGAGDDQADAGSKTFEREQEQSIAANRYLLLIQIQHAIERIDSGTYGICEDCGRPIPKARLKALPMATLDAECKARAERR